MLESNDLAEYSPERIRYWLAGKCGRGCRWSMLESMTEGASGASGYGAGKGNRFSLVCYKADLEHAADLLPIYWQSTDWIYNRQHRRKALFLKRQSMSTTPDANREPEHPIPSQALSEAVWRMARSLGWSEGLTTAA